MPDIAMCRGDDCPFKEKCYRHTAKPDPYWQPMFYVPPIKNGECGYFMSNERNYDER